MDDIKNTLEQKINSAKEITVAVIDDMNTLATLQLEGHAEDALQTSKRASELANSIFYKKGEAQSLLQAGIADAKLRNYESAYTYFNRALSIQNKLNDQEGIAEIHARWGTANLYSGEYTSALEHYGKAIELRNAQGNIQGTADLQTNSGIIHGLLGNYPMALKSHLSALKFYEQTNMKSRLASSCTNIGIIYYEQHDYTEALKMYHRALSIREDAQDQKAVSDLNVNIANVYHDQGNFSAALELHLKALRYREQTGDQSKIAVSLSNLGDVHSGLKQYDTALTYYIQALKLFEALNEKRGLVPSYYNIGELYYLISKPEEAKQYLEKAIQLAEETGLKDHLHEAYERMSKIYAEEQDFERAYQLQIKFVNLYKEITNSETSRMIAQITVRKEIEQKEREAELERTRYTELNKAYHSLDDEKKRSESLLLNILPGEVAEELKQTGTATARQFDHVTIFFSDFVGFTTVSMLLSVQELVDELHHCFKAFDEIISKYPIEKIKTVGDAYLAVSGLPAANAQHASDIIKASLEIRDFMLQRKREMGKRTFEVRIGVNSGSVVAGIVGVKKFAYDIWGDAVNTAARMEQNSEPGKINISQSTFELIKDEFRTDFRGEIEAKNKGKLKMYFVK